MTWNFHTDPRTDSSITLEPRKSKTTKFIFSPNNIDLGTYVIPINIRSQKTDTIETSNFVVSLLSDAEFNGEIYGTAIRTKVYMPSEIDPREEVTITVEIENKNPKDNMAQKGIIYILKFQGVKLCVDIATEENNKGNPISPPPSMATFFS